MRSTAYTNEKRSDPANLNKGQEDSIFSKPFGFGFGPENTGERND